jgi:hypothetical protein
VNTLNVCSRHRTGAMQSLHPSGNNRGEERTFRVCTAFTLAPAIPTGAQIHRLRPFGGRKVHRTFPCFRLTSLKGEGVLRWVPTRWSCKAKISDVSMLSAMSCHFVMHRPVQAVVISIQPVPDLALTAAFNSATSRATDALTYPNH